MDDNKEKESHLLKQIELSTSLIYKRVDYFDHWGNLHTTYIPYHQIVVF